MVVNEAFSFNYGEARSRFLGAAKNSGAMVYTYTHSLKGPDEIDLAIDIACIGPREATQALIIVSGTHGAEGFAGSAIQYAWLNAYRKACLPENFAILLIHALNPFGFAFLRRVNEDNVDLNRNFIDHNNEHPTNEYYSQMGHVMAPTILEGAGRLKLDRELELISLDIGHLNVMRAIGGQYTEAKGMFYGGRLPVWSNRILRQNLPILLPNARIVAYVDIHTGLGPSGYGSLYCYHQKNSKEYDLARSCWGKNLTAASVKINHGKTGHGAIEALRGAKVVCLTLEFGTLPFNEVLKALRDEHALWFYSKNDKGTFTREQFRLAFCRDDDVWRSKIIKQGLVIAEDSIAGLVRFNKK